MASKMFEIDSKHLQKALIDRNVTYAEVSAECGYDVSFVSRVIKQGRASSPFLNALKLRYNIDPAYLIKTEPTPIENPGEIDSQEPEPAKDPIDYGHLKSVIYEAVYEAVKKAWAE